MHMVDTLYDGASSANVFHPNAGQAHGDLSSFHSATDHNTAPHHFDAFSQPAYYSSHLGNISNQSFDPNAGFGGTAIQPDLYDPSLGTTGFQSSFEVPSTGLYNTAGHYPLPDVNQGYFAGGPSVHNPEHGYHFDPNDPNSALHSSNFQTSNDHAGYFNEPYPPYGQNHYQSLRQRRHARVARDWPFKVSPRDGPLLRPVLKAF